MAKIEYATIVLFSIIGFLSKHDFLFMLSVSAQIIFALKNLPGACKVIKSIKNKKK